MLSALVGIGYGTDFEVFEGPDGTTASVAVVWRPRRDRHVRPNSVRNNRNLVADTALSPTDTAVLLLADDADGIAVMDEGHGRDIADVEGIETRGTAYLLLSLAKRGDIPAEEARETVEAILDAGWHCSPNLYAKILRKLEELAPE